MRVLLLVCLLFSPSSAFSPQYIEASDSAYTCNCVLKDEYMPSTTTASPTTSLPKEVPQVAPSETRLPTRFWQLYNSQFRGDKRSDLLSSSFLDRVLGVFRRRTTTPVPLEPQNDATGTALRGLGRTIFTKYLEKLRQDWNVLDRFVCRCQGEIWDVLKARNYLSLTILHD